MAGDQAAGYSSTARSAIRLNWLQAIACLADLDLQKTTWLDPENKNPHWQFVEFVHSYYDCLSVAEDDPYDQPVVLGLFTASEVAVVAELHAALETYEPPGGDRYDLAAILADPSWQEVAAAATRARERLKALLTDPMELGALRNIDRSFTTAGSARRPGTRNW